MTSKDASSKKPKPKSPKVRQTKFVSLAKAIRLCGGEEHTLTLLREGTLQARGRSGTVVPRDQYDRDGNIENIPMECWRDYFLSENKEYLQTDEDFYITAIEIERAQIDALLNAPPRPAHEGNKGGNPGKFDWEEAEIHMMVDLGNKGIPASQNKWINRILGLEYWHVDDAPDESTIRRTWKEKFNKVLALNKKKRTPIR